MVSSCCCCFLIKEEASSLAEGKHSSQREAGLLRDPVEDNGRRERLMV